MSKIWMTQPSVQFMNAHISADFYNADFHLQRISTTLALSS